MQRSEHQSGKCSACDRWCKEYRQKTQRLCNRCHYLWHAAGCPQSFRAPRTTKPRKLLGHASVTQSDEERRSLDRAFAVMTRHPDESLDLDWEALAELREQKHLEERGRIYDRCPARIPGW